MGQPVHKRLLAAALVVSPRAATAQCYADYRARTDDPLRLHLGVAALAEADCSLAAAAPAIAARIASEGWALLEIVPVFGAAELEDKKADAGAYFFCF